jgi:hypothetical protein
MNYVAAPIFSPISSCPQVISFGYRQSLSLSQIKTYTEMDSHEERLHQMIEQSKINEAKDTARKKQLELAKQRAFQVRLSQNEVKLILLKVSGLAFHLSSQNHFLFRISELRYLISLGQASFLALTRFLN